MSSSTMMAEEVPEHTLFVITTDGMENASRGFNSEEVKQLIQKMKEEKNWEFLFLTANIDAVETAAHYGILEDRAVTYRNDAQGTDALYDSINDAVGHIRANRPMASEWKRRIEQDR